ncbi:MAG: hypothetical protein V4455_07660 [Pseudomonadota bacterium]
MFRQFSVPVAVHRSSTCATHPIAPPWRVLAALLLLAGISPPPRHVLPSHPMTTHSGTSNYSI